MFWPKGENLSLHIPPSLGWHGNQVIGYHKATAIFNLSTAAEHSAANTFYNKAAFV